ncbi:MAG: amidohydrolase [Acidobacteria bacterium]|nr:amidohydrolase [Acidobacteriota bacterium]
MKRWISVGVAASVLVAVSLVAQDRRGAQLSAPMTVEDYVPRSTLIVPEHPVPSAKFPVVDVHSHHRPGLSGRQWERIVGEMDDLNLQVLVNLSGGSGATLASSIEVIRRSPHPDRMVFFANLDFSRGVTPGFGERAAAQLRRDVEAGAVGLKIFKNFGLTVLDVSGQRVQVDDPELVPVWEVCATLGIPVLIHTGEPSEFFEPVDRHNERWLELVLRPGRRLPADRYPSFDTIMAERDRMFARHPDTTFIAAHMGWHANDLGRLGDLLDQLPNVVVGTGAILYELGRQPRTAKAFFEQYANRVLFGKDSYRAEEFPYYWRTFETEDEYFDYYRRYHAFWKLYGLGLSDDVLRKVYYENALRVVPGIPRNGFPPLH